VKNNDKPSPTQKVKKHFFGRNLGPKIKQILSTPSLVQVQKIILIPIMELDKEKIFRNFAGNSSDKKNQF